MSLQVANIVKLEFFDSTNNYMMEEQWIIKETCAKQSDPNECAMLVKNYLPTVAHRLFTDSNAKMVCGGLDPECSSYYRFVRFLPSSS